MRRLLASALLASVSAFAPTRAAGQAPELTPPEGPASESAAESDADAAAGTDTATETGTEPDPEEEVIAVRTRRRARDEARDEARGVVTQVAMFERQARSAPDALRFVPGVTIQQSAHGQASPTVRGMTGQQVVHVFDGVRLNSGIYRQGPNQYFFSVDARTLDRLEVVRGGSAVRHGADAMGGAILAYPVRTPRGEGTARALPSVSLRGTSADREWGGRAALALVADGLALTIGAGYRDVGLLRSGGAVDHLRRPAACDDPTSTDPLSHGDCSPWTPRFVEEATHPDPRDRAAWRTQLGTGFREATFDARLEAELSRDRLLTMAVYGYRQLDAPRTDQCPPQEAPISECLSIDEQFRTLSLVRLERHDAARLDHWAVTASHQRHHEVRVRDRPLSFVRFDFEDEVDTFGLTFVGEAAFEGVLGGELALDLGAETYLDRVRSAGAQTLTDLDYREELSRGQYLAGSTFSQSSAFADARLAWTSETAVEAGARLGTTFVRAPADPESGTLAVSESYFAGVARVGVSHVFARRLQLTAQVDQSYRAPNLDDLTSRQQSGPGFQFENPALGPEKATTYELGVSLELPYLELVAWGFTTLVRDAIVRAPRDATDCPPMTPACGASRNQFQLVNAPGRSRYFGYEAAATLRLPAHVDLRMTISQVVGDTPDLRGMTNRVPLSRVPPTSGAFELRYATPVGLVLGTSLRWAARQIRLSPADLGDVRIPLGGTAGYALWDVRATYRAAPGIEVALVGENLLDAAYRVHGSSINGAGRGVVAAVTVSRR